MDVYGTIKMTTFLTIFPKISEYFPKISEDSSKVVQRLDERFRTFPKISEDC